MKKLIKNWKLYLTENLAGNSAHAVLYKNGTVLIVRRSTDSDWMPNHYAFPGGKIENGESTVSGLCRECKEELNLDIHPNNCKFLSDISNKIGHNFFLITNFKGNLQLNNEHDDFKWINPKDLSNFKTVPDLKSVIAAALQHI